LDISALDEMELFSSGPAPASSSGDTHIIERNPAPAPAPSGSASSVFPKPGAEAKKADEVDSEGRSYSLEEYVRLKKTKSPAG
jgi:hypothetical protein